MGICCCAFSPAADSSMLLREDLALEGMLFSGNVEGISNVLIDKAVHGKGKEGLGF